MGCLIRYIKLTYDIACGYKSLFLKELDRGYDSVSPISYSPNASSSGLRLQKNFEKEKSTNVGTGDEAETSEETPQEFTATSSTLEKTIYEAV